MKKNNANHSIEPSSLDNELELLKALYDKSFEYHLDLLNRPSHLSNQLRNTIAIIPIFIAGFIATLPYTWDYSSLNSVMSVLSITLIGLALLCAFFPLIKTFIPFWKIKNTNTTFSIPYNNYFHLKEFSLNNHSNNTGLIDVYKKLLYAMQDSNKDNKRVINTINRFIGFSSTLLLCSIIVFSINIASYFISGGRLWETKPKIKVIKVLNRPIIIPQYHPIISYQDQQNILRKVTMVVLKKTPSN